MGKHLELVRAALWDHVAPAADGRRRDPEALGYRAWCPEVIEGRSFEHIPSLSMLYRPVKHTVSLSVHAIPVSADNLTIGQRIRAAREAKALDQKPLAKAARITVSALSQIETGATKNPKPQHIFAIADALDVEARYLVFGHTDRVAPSLMALRLSETGRFRIRRNRGTTGLD